MKKSIYNALKADGRRRCQSSPAGSKLARKAAESRVGARSIGVVSKAYEQMSKDRRAA